MEYGKTWKFGNKQESLSSPVERLNLEVVPYFHSRKLQIFKSSSVVILLGMLISLIL